MKKLTALFSAFCVFMCFEFSACTDMFADNRQEVLLCYAGDDTDEFGGGVYREAVESLKCGFQVLELGSNANTYRNDVAEALSKKDYKAVVVAGAEAYNGLYSYIKSYKGMNFIALDCRLKEIRDNVAAVEFDPEEFGYLGGRLVAEGTETKVGYLSSVRNAFDNRVLYGFLQGVGEKDVAVKYTEEQSNIVKAKDYVSAMYQSGVARVFDTSGRSSLGSLDGAYAQGGKIVYGGVNLTEAASEARDKATVNTIVGGVEKNYAAALTKIGAMVKDGLQTGKTTCLTVSDGAYLVNGTEAQKVTVKPLSGNETDFATLAKRINEDVVAYTPQYTVEAAYHEAVPSCADTNDWKYAPRAGSGNGMKPVGWKGVGVWSTIYLQEGQTPVSNTGIEFQNMKIWAYTKTIGWKLLEHANPTGSFYDEDFSNDSHASFISNYFNDSQEKRTRIKFDYSTLGYNYHPFGSQIDLVEAGFLNEDGSVKNGDALYILSEMDIRLCVWDASIPSDIDDAKFVANIGADWWREKGLNWTPDWNSNKDVCVGQFRTITKDWKKLYMTNVPSGQYEEVFKTFPFNE